MHSCRAYSMHRRWGCFCPHFSMQQLTFIMSLPSFWHALSINFAVTSWTILHCCIIYQSIVQSSGKTAEMSSDMHSHPPLLRQQPALYQIWSSQTAPSECQWYTKNFLQQSLQAKVLSQSIHAIVDWLPCTVKSWRCTVLKSINEL